MGLTDSIEKIHSGFEDLYNLSSSPINKTTDLLTSHPLYQHKTTQKIVKIVSSQTITFFILTHVYGWYYAPLGFEIGLGIGSLGGIIHRLGFSKYNFQVIKSRSALQKFPLIMLILSLFITNLGRGILSGFVLGTWGVHHVVEYASMSFRKKITEIKQGDG